MPSSMPQSTHLIPPSSQLTCPTDSDASSDDPTSDGVQAIVVDDSDEKSDDGDGEVTEEDDDVKLGM